MNERHFHQRTEEGRHPGKGECVDYQMLLQWGAVDPTFGPRPPLFLVKMKPDDTVLVCLVSASFGNSAGKLFSRGVNTNVLKYFLFV